jgi:translation initiation factor IF-2
MANGPNVARVVVGAKAKRRKAPPKAVGRGALTKPKPHVNPPGGYRFGPNPNDVTPGFVDPPGTYQDPHGAPPPIQQGGGRPRGNPPPAPVGRPGPVTQPGPFPPGWGRPGVRPPPGQGGPTPPRPGPSPRGNPVVKPISGSPPQPDGGWRTRPPGGGPGGGTWQATNVLPKSPIKVTPGATKLQGRKLSVQPKNKRKASQPGYRV